MKKLALLALTLSICACDSGPAERAKAQLEQAKSKQTKIDTGVAGEYIEYCIVTIDGKDYIATQSRGGWSLCPK